MEAAVTIGRIRRHRRPKREKPDEASKIVKLDALTPNVIRTLESGYRQARDSAANLTDGFRSIADKCGIKASALRAFIAARVGDKYQEKKAAVEQLSLLFEEIGE